MLVGGVRDADENHDRPGHCKLSNVGKAIKVTHGLKFSREPR